MEIKFRSELELSALTDDELQAHYYATIVARKESDSAALAAYQSLVLATLDNRFGGCFLDWPGNWAYNWKLA